MVAFKEALVAVRPVLVAVASYLGQGLSAPYLVVFPVVLVVAACTGWNRTMGPDAVLVRVRWRVSVECHPALRNALGSYPSTVEIHLTSLTKRP